MPDDKESEIEARYLAALDHAVDQLPAAVRPWVAERVDETLELLRLSTARRERNEAALRALTARVDLVEAKLSQ